MDRRNSLSHVWIRTDAGTENSALQAKKLHFIVKMKTTYYNGPNAYRGSHLSTGSSQP